VLTVYRKDDLGAPEHKGVPGRLIGVLDACLVNGDGAQLAVGWAKVSVTRTKR
jgi:hypothetical protein